MANNNNYVKFVERSREYSKHAAIILLTSRFLIKNTETIRFLFKPFDYKNSPVRCSYIFIHNDRIIRHSRTAEESVKYIRHQSGYSSHYDLCICLQNDDNEDYDMFNTFVNTYLLNTEVTEAFRTEIESDNSGKCVVFDISAANNDSDDNGVKILDIARKDYILDKQDMLNAYRIISTMKQKEEYSKTAISRKALRSNIKKYNKDNPILFFHASHSFGKKKHVLVFRFKKDYLSGNTFETTEIYKKIEKASGSDPTTIDHSTDNIYLFEILNTQKGQNQRMEHTYKYLKDTNKVLNDFLGEYIPYADRKWMHYESFPIVTVELNSKIIITFQHSLECLEEINYNTVNCTGNSRKDIDYREIVISNINYRSFVDNHFQPIGVDWFHDIINLCTENIMSMYEQAIL